MLANSFKWTSFLNSISIFNFIFCFYPYRFFFCFLPIDNSASSLHNLFWCSLTRVFTIINFFLALLNHTAEMLKYPFSRKFKESFHVSPLILERFDNIFWEYKLSHFFYLSPSLLQYCKIGNNRIWKHEVLLLICAYLQTWFVQLCAKFAMGTLGLDVHPFQF